MRTIISFDTDAHHNILGRPSEVIRTSVAGHQLSYGCPSGHSLMSISFKIDVHQGIRGRLLAFTLSKSGIYMSYFNQDLG